MNDANGNADPESKGERRQVPVLLIEATPMARGLLHWILASPMILFIGWFWLDLFAYLSPIPWYGLDAIIGTALYLLLVLLPFGYGAHKLVTALPRLFQNAGWDVQVLVPIRPEEQYSVQYIYTEKRRAETTPARVWVRAAQGWVYLEIAAIFIGAIAIIPLFFSVLDFSFGR